MKPVYFLSGLIIFLVFHFSVSQAGDSALGQLEDMTGQKVDRFKPPRVPPPQRVSTPLPQAQQRTVPKVDSNVQIQKQMTGMLLEGIFSEVFSDPSSGNQAAAEQQQQIEAEKIRLEQERLKIEQQRRAELVQQQRARRESENDKSLEEMSAALSEKWDGAAGSRNDPGVVDLRGKKGVVPLAAKQEQPKNTEAPSPEAKTRERLHQMALENEKVDLLMKKLEKLEGNLDQTIKEAIRLKREQKYVAAQFGSIEEDIAKITDETTKRAISMSLGPLLAGNKKTIQKLDGILQHNETMKREMLEHLNNVNDFVAFSEDISQVKEDIDWLRAKRNLVEDLQYVTERLEIGGAYYEYGKSIVQSSVDVYKELVAIRKVRELEGVNEGFWDQKKNLDTQLKVLQVDLKKTRAEISKATGLDPGSSRKIKKEGHDGLSKPVPHPYD